MEHAEVIRQAAKIVRRAGLEDSPLCTSNFLDYADLVKDIIANWPRKKRTAKGKGLKDFLEGLKEIRDDFEALVASDPLMIYKPAHHVSLEFHQSLAKWRYFRGGNGISKTQSAVADNYWVVTRQHPYRPLPPAGGSVFVIGTNFSKYAPAVFETKYVLGENGNPLSPAFPEGGKWFHHYDDRKHILTVSCPECASNGKPKQCPSLHIKPVLRLFSDVEGPSVLAGARYAQGQFDEQINYLFWSEALKRIENVPNSGLIVTETPIYGKAWWTHSVLTVLAESKPEENLIPGTNKVLVSLHCIDQYSAGLVPKEDIDASKMGMTEPEIQARIYGLPVAANEQSVLDLVTLSVMREETKPPRLGNLLLKVEHKGAFKLESQHDPDLHARVILEKADEKQKVEFRISEQGMLYLWEPPLPTEQYLICADVAQGLTKRDYSCADVYRLRLEDFQINLEQVAQFHGWISSIPYGEELMKLAIYYNSGVLAVERNGPGDATIQTVKDLGYWNLYQDLNSAIASRQMFDQFYGVDTTSASKPMMISMLQSAIKDKRTGKRTLIIRSNESLTEMENYVQAPSSSGKTFKFGAIGTMHDDRVIPPAIGVYIVRTNPNVYDVELARSRKLDGVNWRNKDERTQKFWNGFHQQLKRKTAR